MAKPLRRNGRGRTAEPAALAARLPEHLRSLDGFASPADYTAAVRDWLRSQGVPMPTFEEAARGAEAIVSVSEVAEAAGVSVVQAHFRRWLTRGVG